MTREALPTGTKRSLLDLLLRTECTVEDLAARLGVSATAVRQHLATLSGLGFVERRKAETEGGRPAYLYRLSAEARRAYPKRHDLLARALVQALLAREGSEGALAMVTEAARRIADEIRDRLPNGRPETRWPAAMAWLEAELEWEAEFEETATGSRRVILHQCPFMAVSADHPMVCGAFLTTLLERLTQSGGFVHQPIRDGVRCCALEARGGGRPSEAVDTVSG